jgi:hypothetical protein
MLVFAGYGLRAGGGVSGAQIHRVPDAVQRPLRCTAEPGPTLLLCDHGPQISSAPRRYCGVPRSIRGTSKASEGVSEIQFVSQIAPIRVELLDQSDFPSTAPALQGMFSRASFKDGIERFEIDELVDLAFARETGNKLGLML